MPTQELKLKGWFGWCVACGIVKQKLIFIDIISRKLSSLFHRTSANKSGNHWKTLQIGYNLLIVKPEPGGHERDDAVPLGAVSAIESSVKGTIALQFVKYLLWDCL